MSGSVQRGKSMRLHFCRYCARVELGPLDVQIGGMLRRHGQVRLWDGVHVMWGDRVVRVFWNSLHGAHVQARREPLPTIPEPPGECAGCGDTLAGYRARANGKLYCQSCVDAAAEAWADAMGYS